MQNFDPNIPAVTNINDADLLAMRNNQTSLRSCEAGPNDILVTPGQLWADESEAGDSILRVMRINAVENFVVSWEPGTKVLFKQAYAPTGWTTDVTVPDKSMTRCVWESSYVGSSGTEFFDEDTLYTDVETGHTHVVSGNTVGAIANLQANGNEAGGSFVSHHTHSVSLTSETSSHNHGIKLLRTDVIVATKD